MNKQITLSQISDELAQTSTKRREFLRIMERMISRQEWAVLVKPCYDKGKRGNTPNDLERMLRI